MVVVVVDVVVVVVVVFGFLGLNLAFEDRIWLMGFNPPVSLSGLAARSTVISRLIMLLSTGEI